MRCQIYTHTHRR